VDLAYPHDFGNLHIYLHQGKASSEKVGNVHSFMAGQSAIAPQSTAGVEGEALPVREMLPRTDWTILERSLAKYCVLLKHQTMERPGQQQETACIVLSMGNGGLTSTCGI
jgi:hypothetical protein